MMPRKKGERKAETEERLQLSNQSLLSNLIHGLESIHLEKMRTENNLIRAASFVIKPLFTKGRWLAWGLLALILMLMGNTITAVRMEIPSPEEVHRVNGKFVDTTTIYSRTGLFSIGIQDDIGNIYKCSCEPLVRSNCLGRNASDHAEIRNQLNPEVISKYTLHKATIIWLSGRRGEVWMYPNKSFFGSPYSCYKISTNGYTLRSFEQSVRDYTEAKKGFSVHAFLFLSASILLALSVFLIFRISMFRREVGNGQPRD